MYLGMTEPRASFLSSWYLGSVLHVLYLMTSVIIHILPYCFVYVLNIMYKWNIGLTSQM